MTFCGGEIAADGLDTEGSGRGVDIWCLRVCWSLPPFRDLRRDFMMIQRRQQEIQRRVKRRADADARLALIYSIATNGW